jgi:hypothetical protein
VKPLVVSNETIKLRAFGVGFVRPKILGSHSWAFCFSESLIAYSLSY